MVVYAVGLEEDAPLDRQVVVNVSETMAAQPSREPSSTPSASAGPKPPPFYSSLDIDVADERDFLPDGTASSGSHLGPALDEAGEPVLKERNRFASSSANQPAAERASRTAKVSALSALKSQQAGGTLQDGGAGPAASKNPIRKGGLRPKSTPLDLDTLAQGSPRHVPARRKRIFGLEPAPVYYPTIEEFAQPLEYIEKISPEASKYGLCKVIPPEGWNPSFALNTETFRFKTRVMRLNSMEVAARASLNFLEQLYLFHRQQGKSRISIPNIGGWPVDLWRLRKEVALLGGYEQVCSTRKWSSLAKVLGYDVEVSAAVSTQLKVAHARIIKPFEEYVERISARGGDVEAELNALKAKDPELGGKGKGPATPGGTGFFPTPTSMASTSGNDGAEAPVTMERVQEASAKLNEALQSDPVGDARAIPSLLPSSSVQKKKKAATPELPPGEVCEICSMDHTPEAILLCDGCDRGFHMDCLTPALKEVPDSQFFCNACLVMTGADYAFEEGQEHSLHTFRRRADIFKERWLDHHPIPLNKGKRKMAANGEDIDDETAEMFAREDHLEREFWRLVESQGETVEVEYGADIDSTKDGGGLPNLESRPLDPYSRDGWNLNNLPILSGSLLRYIKSDISGMTVPWLYVGMLFSTFAWHKEDHYTYSINYQHFGDTKTWYGVPAEDDVKLDHAMKTSAPELFEQQPDLMFQLVTLMSPGRLKKNGVRVYSADQRPNEFVITFPKAYHSGFNHGFNFNEAVNFALKDWVNYGQECSMQYKTIKKAPVFSHDELLITIAHHDRSVATSQWLLPHWKAMVEKELASRDALRRDNPGLVEVVEAFDRPEKDFQCEHCRGFSYLSQVITTGDPKKQQHIACLNHFKQLPAGQPKALRIRIADSDLKANLTRMKGRVERTIKAAAPAALAAAAASTTGRKRRPSALAREAAGEETLGAAEQMKIDLHASSDDSSDDEVVIVSHSPKRRKVDEDATPSTQMEDVRSTGPAVASTSTSLAPATVVSRPPMPTPKPSLQPSKPPSPPLTSIAPRPVVAAPTPLVAASAPRPAQPLPVKPPVLPSLSSTAAPAVVKPAEPMRAASTSAPSAPAAKSDTPYFSALISQSSRASSTGVANAPSPAPFSTARPAPPRPVASVNPSTSATASSSFVPTAVPPPFLPKQPLQSASFVPPPASSSSSPQLPTPQPRPFQTAPSPAPATFTAPPAAPAGSPPRTSVFVTSSNPAPSSVTGTTLPRVASNPVPSTTVTGATLPRVAPAAAPAATTSTSTMPTARPFPM